jgi:hypothetical protein
MNLLELSRYAFLAGALPYVFLGIAHVLVTPRTAAESRGLSPRDRGTREAMVRDTLVMTRHTTLWNTWVGFNLSHSLGAILFGVAVLLVGRTPASFAGQAAVFLPFALAVAATYLWIGARYWFRKPIVGISISCACFTAASVFFASAR